MAQVGHALFILNCKINIGATSGVIRMFGGLAVYLGDRSKQMIVTKMASETTGPGRRTCRLGWRWYM